MIEQAGMKRLLLFLCLAAAARPDSTKVLTTDTLWDWRTPGDPQISPDGRQVVYTLSWNDRMNDATHTNLWITGVDGADERPLTLGPCKDTFPRWSSDGKRLAYLSNRGSGKVQIWVRWIDTGQEAQITDLQQPPANIAWSPDGKWIAYSARVPARPEWQVPMPERPAGARWADPPIVITRLRWRQDGSGLIPPGYTHLFIVPSTGGAPRQITSGDFNHVAAGPDRAGGASLAWTPDGQWLLSSCTRSPEADYSLEGPDIWAFSVKDGTPRQLTTRRGPDGTPTPSPDG
jgi:acylaminoacyl-peptidase